MDKEKSKYHYLNLVLKVIIFALLCWGLYHQFTSKGNVENIIEIFLSAFTADKIIYFIGVMVLLIVNWGIEAKKWTLLIDKFQKISWFHSFKAILAGVTFSMFTPNRVGEFGGRVLFLDAGLKGKGAAVTLLGSLSQWVASFTLGCIALVFFALKNSILEDFLLAVLFGFIGISVFLLFFLYYNAYLFERIIANIKWISKYSSYFSSYKEYDKTELTSLLLWSGLRFIVFSVQYYLLLLFFGLEVDFLVGFSIIGSIYLVQTIIPSISLLEIPLRGNIALYFWGIIGMESSGVFATTYFLWLINLVLPALIGMLFLAELNIVRAIEEETK